MLEILLLIITYRNIVLYYHIFNDVIKKYIGTTTGSFFVNLTNMSELQQLWESIGIAHFVEDYPI